MAKKQAGSFNMSESLREILTANPEFTAAQASEAILAKHPGAQINKGSFNVAFYTGRKKLGIGSRKGNRVGIRKSRQGESAGTDVDMAALQAAAKFLRECGNIDVALAALKTVQAVQILDN